MAIRIDTAAMQAITTRFLTQATKIQLEGTREYYNDPLNPDPEDTSTESWVSSALTPSFSNQSTEFNLTSDLVFTISFPANTKEIFIDTANLLNLSDTALIKAEIPGTVSYTGAGEFTLTEFAVAFNVVPQNL